MFGAESDIPPLCSPGVALVSDPAGKAELLSTWFDSKQSRDIVELPLEMQKKSVFYRKKQFFNVFFLFFSITGRFLINYSAIRVYL